MCLHRRIILSFPVAFWYQLCLSEINEETLRNNSLQKDYWHVQPNGWSNLSLKVYSRRLIICPWSGDRSVATRLQWWKFDVICNSRDVWLRQSAEMYDRIYSAAPAITGSLSSDTYRPMSLPLGPLTLMLHCAVRSKCRKSWRIGVMWLAICFQLAPYRPVDSAFNRYSITLFHPACRKSMISELAMYVSWLVNHVIAAAGI